VSEFVSAPNISSHWFQFCISILGAVLPAISEVILGSEIPFPTKVIKEQWRIRMMHRRERLSSRMKTAIGYPGRGWIQQAENALKGIKIAIPEGEFLLR
jgi:hypothetical protein